VSRYIVECHHASGLSHWDREPDTEEYETEEAAEAIIQKLEAEDEEGAALEYRVVEVATDDPEDDAACVAEMRHEAEQDVWRMAGDDE